MTDNPADSMLQWRTTEFIVTASMEPDSPARRKALNMLRQSSGKSMPESNATGGATNPPSGASHEREEQNVSGKDVSPGKEPQRPPVPDAKTSPGNGYANFNGEYFI